MLNLTPNLMSPSDKNLLRLNSASLSGCIPLLVLFPMTIYPVGFGFLLFCLLISLAWNEKEQDVQAVCSENNIPKGDTQIPVSMAFASSSSTLL
jgi:hypothetical protein